MFIKLTIISLIMFVISILWGIIWEDQELESYKKAKNDAENKGTRNLYYAMIFSVGLSLLFFLIFLILSILFW